MFFLLFFNTADTIHNNDLKCGFETRKHLPENKLRLSFEHERGASETVGVENMHVNNCKLGFCQVKELHPFYFYYNKIAVLLFELTEIVVIGTTKFIQ